MSRVLTNDGQGVWFGRGGISIDEQQIVSRESLVPGVDMPNKLVGGKPVNVGPYSVTSFENVYPAPGQNYITITQPGTYYGKRYWGQVRFAAGLADWSVKFRECHVLGLPPESVTVANNEMIRAYGPFPIKWEMYDSIIDPLLWTTSLAPGGARASLSPYTTGLKGGNARVRRTEFANMHDGWNWIGPDGQMNTSGVPSTDGLAAVAAQEHLSEMNWYHKGYYRNNVIPPNDGQPHVDAIQTNFGRNFTSRGDYIGGSRVMSGYWTWPNNPGAPIVGTGHNAGDDWFGAGIQMANERGAYTNGQGQAVSIYVPSVHEIENFIVEDGWIEGCGAGINHGTKDANPSDWAGTEIRGMRFYPRGSDWGYSYQFTTRDSNPQVNDPVERVGSAAGVYIIRPTKWSSMYTDNTRIDTGLPVTISNGY
jgi:hypothetical protein